MDPPGFVDPTIRTPGTQRWPCKWDAIPYSLSEWHEERHLRIWKTFLRPWWAKTRDCHVVIHGHCMFRTEFLKLWASALWASAAQGACKSGNSPAPLQTYGTQISWDEARNLCFHKYVCTLKVGKHYLGMSTVVILSGGTWGDFYIVIVKCMFFL